jgi:hypothetical protein
LYPLSINKSITLLDAISTTFISGPLPITEDVACLLAA